MGEITDPLLSCVYIVDDEGGMRDLHSKICRPIATKVESFASAADFLAAYRPSTCDCVVTDLRMPGMSGIELQQELARKHPTLPVIILTGQGDIRLAVDAIQKGAFDFLEKPCPVEILRRRVQDAFATSAIKNIWLRKSKKTQDRLQKLTPREREVLGLALKGCFNKTIADLLKISEKTVEVHRRNIRNKMNVKSIMELASDISGMDHNILRENDTFGSIDIEKYIFEAIDQCSLAEKQGKCNKVLRECIKKEIKSYSKLYYNMRIIMCLQGLIDECEYNENQICPARLIIGNIKFLFPI